MPKPDVSRFLGLTYDAYRELANDSTLSQYNKIGFPDSYREGYEELILRDILEKLRPLRETNKTIFDIGCGCSSLPRMIIEHCAAQQHTLLLMDSPEMLAHLPDSAHIRKFSGRYPGDADAIFAEYSERVDAIIVYSVFQHVYVEGNIYAFLDKSLGLLAEGGMMLIGDIPNVSKRKRFFATNAGIRYHQNYTQTDEVPEVNFNTREPDIIDDAVLIGLMLHCRAQGFEAYIVPQAPDLPLANRREDLLILRP